jgi:hypothetical protein
MESKEDINTLIAAMSVSGALGLVVGIMRGVIQQKHGSFAAFVRGILASILVAVFVSWGLADSGLSATTKATITGICSFIADDILLGLMSLAALMGRDPIGFFTRIVAAYRGQAPQQPTPKEEQGK